MQVTVERTKTSTFLQTMGQSIFHCVSLVFGCCFRTRKGTTTHSSFGDHVHSSLCHDMGLPPLVRSDIQLRVPLDFIPRIQGTPHNYQRIPAGGSSPWAQAADQPLTTTTTTTTTNEIKYFLLQNQHVYEFHSSTCTFFDKHHPEKRFHCPAWLFERKVFARMTEMSDHRLLVYRNHGLTLFVFDPQYPDQGWATFELTLSLREEHSPLPTPTLTPTPRPRPTPAQVWAQKQKYMILGTRSSATSTWLIVTIYSYATKRPRNWFVNISNQSVKGIEPCIIQLPWLPLWTDETQPVGSVQHSALLDISVDRIISQFQSKQLTLFENWIVLPLLPLPDMERKGYMPQRTRPVRSEVEVSPHSPSCLSILIHIQHKTIFFSSCMNRSIVHWNGMEQKWKRICQYRPDPMDDESLDTHFAIHTCEECHSDTAALAFRFTKEAGWFVPIDENRVVFLIPYGQKWMVDWTHPEPRCAPFSSLHRGHGHVQ